MGHIYDANLVDITKIDKQYRPKVMTTDTDAAEINSNIDWM